MMNNIGTKIIETDRLTIRSIMEDDWISMKQIKGVYL